MRFNYRVIKSTNFEEDCFAIHDVYYDEDLKIISWSKDPRIPYGDNLSELILDLEHMREATEKSSLVLHNGNLVEL